MALGQRSAHMLVMALLMTFGREHEPILASSPKNKTLIHISLENNTSTVVERIPGSLLPNNTPGIRLGSVIRSDIRNLCRAIVEGGISSVTEVTVVSQNSSKETDIASEVRNVTGCEAEATSQNESAPEFLVYAGRKYLIVVNCPTSPTGSETEANCNAYSASKVGDGKKHYPSSALYQTTFTPCEICRIDRPCTYCLHTKDCMYPEQCHLPHCFPGDAVVKLPSGQHKLMSELQLGDKVSVWKADGWVGYEEIYAFGHKDATSTSEFVKMTMAPLGVDGSEKEETLSLELSAFHFAPVSAGNGGTDNIFYKRAKDVRLGDKMWATANSGAIQQRTILCTVTGISATVKKGLYNPFTTSGTILVNGVAASVHSEWFLDGVFDAFGLTHWLPVVYQIVLAPVRTLYKVLGRNLYIVIYNSLDARVDLPRIATDYSGATASIACAMVAPLLVFLVFRNKTKA